MAELAALAALPALGETRERGISNAEIDPSSSIVFELGDDFRLLQVTEVLSHMIYSGSAFQAHSICAYFGDKLSRNVFCSAIPTL